MSKDKCKACGAPIEWVKTGKGRPVPINTRKLAVFIRDPSKGNTWKLTHGHESHFATCPDAGKFRRDQGPPKEPTPSPKSTPTRQTVSLFGEEDDKRTELLNAARSYRNNLLANHGFTEQWWDTYLRDNWNNQLPSQMRTSNLICLVDDLKQIFEQQAGAHRDYVDPGDQV